jgi:hypothetical protein
LKVFISNEETMGANNSIPVLRALLAGGDEAIPFSVEDAAACKVYRGAGLEVRTPQSYGLGVFDGEGMASILRREAPDVIVAGVSVVSVEDRDPAKLALMAGERLGIPRVLLLGTWPHLWLSNYGERDLPVYGSLDAVCAFDGLARERFLEAGFPGDRVHITGNPENDGLPDFISRRPEVRRKFREQFKIGEDATLLTFAVTMNVEGGALDVPEGDPRWIGFNESAVLREFLDGVATSGNASIRSIVRIKPGRERGPIEALIRERCPSALLLGEEYRNGREILMASDAVVGTVTIMLQEAAFLDVLPVAHLPRLSRPDPQVANTIGVTKVLRGYGSLADFVRGVAADRSVIESERVLLEPVCLVPNATANVIEVLRKAARS